MRKDNFVTGSLIFAKYLRYLKGIFLANTSFGLKDRSLFLSEWTEVKKQRLSQTQTEELTNHSLLQDKKKIFDKQRSKMQKRNSSFLDSIRMEVENEEEF